jgi:hypothetical protein
MIFLLNSKHYICELNDYLNAIFFQAVFLFFLEKKNDAFFSSHRIRTNSKNNMIF